MLMIWTCKSDITYHLDKYYDKTELKNYDCFTQILNLYDILDSLSFFISIKGQDPIFQDIYFIKFWACIVIEQLIFNSLILKEFEYIYKYNLKNLVYCQVKCNRK